MSERTERLLRLVERAVPVTSAHVAAVPDDRWLGPSPCGEMTVIGLVEHLVGGLAQFAAAGAGGLTEEMSFEHAIAPTDALAAYEAAAAEMVAAWSAPGVADVDYAMPWGETPGHMLLGFMVIEQVVHGWDIARATGQEPGFDDDLAEATLELMRQYDDTTIRAPGMFGPEVPVADDAPAIERLIAFVGRDPT